MADLFVFPVGTLEVLMLFSKIKTITCFQIKYMIFQSGYIYIRFAPIFRSLKYPILL